MNIFKKINIRKKLHAKRRQLSIRTAHEKHKISFKNEYVDVHNIIKKFRSGGGLKHDFQHYKLWELKQYLHTYQPDNILECGSGSSTLIFAEYVNLNNKKLTTYDESIQWLEHTKYLLGSSFSSKIEMRHADRVLGFDGEITTVNYDIEPSEEYDFVMVDGPSQRINSIRRKDSVNADILRLRYLPKIILVDGRESTFKYLSEKLSSKYISIPSDLHTGGTVKPGYNYFSKLLRK